MLIIEPFTLKKCFNPLLDQPLESLNLYLRTLITQLLKTINKYNFHFYLSVNLFPLFLIPFLLLLLSTSQSNNCIPSLLFSVEIKYSANLIQI